MSADESPLTPLEQALVQALVSALVKELQSEDGDGRERERPGDQTEALVEPERTCDGHADDTAHLDRRQVPTTSRDRHARVTP
jgi:hypothetical protein